MLCQPLFFFFNDTATTEIYTLSLHDALPITRRARARRSTFSRVRGLASAASTTHDRASRCSCARTPLTPRSEEHTSELQSRLHLVCRLLLEKKKPVSNLLHCDATASSHVLR